MFANLFRRPPAQKSFLDLLAKYAERIRVCAEELETKDSQRFWEMAGGIDRIASHVAEDRADASKLRLFIRHHLKHIVEISEAYTNFKVNGAPAEQTNAISNKIDEYADLINAAEQACFKNDFKAIELTMSALDDQLKRLRL